MEIPTPVLVRCEDFKTVALPPAHILDPRWPHVKQFLNRSEISPGSRRTYEFALRRFLCWCTGTLDASIADLLSETTTSQN